jgi:hypothetical protein
MAIKRHIPASRGAELVGFVAGPHAGMIITPSPMIDGGFAA